MADWQLHPLNAVYPVIFIDAIAVKVRDGLKGLPEAITTVWEFTQVQTCVIHLIRGHVPLRRPPGLGRHRPRPQADLSPSPRGPGGAPTAVNAEQGAGRLDDFAEKWVGKYPAAVKLWRSAWGEYAAVPGLRRPDP